MANKQPISSELTLSTVNREGEQPSEGKIELTEFYKGMNYTLIKQKPSIRCSLYPLAGNKLNLARAWYEEGMSGVEDHVQKIQFSGNSADLDFEPTGNLTITVVLARDMRGVPMGTSVGGSVTPLLFNYDTEQKKIVATRPNKSILVVEYQVSWCMIRYLPHGQINLAGGNVTTYGTLYVHRAIPLENQSVTDGCATQAVRTYFGEIDLTPPEMYGDKIEICSVTSEFINWENKAYEIPPNYPGSSTEDRRVPAGTQGSSVILPAQNDGETWQFPRKHIIWTMDTYSGVVTKTENNPNLAHPHHGELWENVSSYIPKFAFGSTKPSEKHAAELFDKVDWDGIKDYVRKTFPGCTGV